MNTKLTIERIYQPDLSLRSMSVFMDGVEIGGMMPGDKLELDMTKITHYIKVKVWPYSSVTLLLDKENITENHILYAGLFYRNIFEGFSLRSLKLLTKREYVQFKNEPLLTMKFRQLLAVIISGILSGSILLYYSLFGLLIENEAKWIFLLGIGAIIGSIAAYFYRKIPGSTFVYYKPFLDAGALVFLSFIIQTRSLVFFALVEIPFVQTPLFRLFETPPKNFCMVCIYG